MVGLCRAGLVAAVGQLRCSDRREPFASVNEFIAFATAVRSPKTTGAPRADSVYYPYTYESGVASVGLTWGVAWCFLRLGGYRSNR